MLYIHSLIFRSCPLCWWRHSDFNNIHTHDERGKDVFPAKATGYTNIFEVVQLNWCLQDENRWRISSREQHSPNPKSPFRSFFSVQVIQWDNIICNSPLRLVYQQFYMAFRLSANLTGRVSSAQGPLHLILIFCIRLDIVLSRLQFNDHKYLPLHTYIS